MEYKVGDRVRIKSLDWYNENINNKGIIVCGSESFTHPMSHFCNEVVNIITIQDNCYRIFEDGGDWYWTDEMIEGLVEEETKPNIIEEAKTYWDSIKDAWICPEGYIFKDENGNVINTTKIVLEKKKKEYPKTFLECCDVLNIGNLIERGVKGYKAELFDILQKLYICRDAYWKIAGEEMGLGKPWEPDWGNPDHDSYPTITRCGGKIIRTTIYTHDCPFSFPTEEMRDAFYENFKELIEQCKEML